MPHDRKGAPLAVGQRVQFEGTVKSVSPSESACNCCIKVDAPAGEYAPEISLNSKSVEIVGAGTREPDAHDAENS